MTAEQKKAAPVLSVNHVVKAFGAKRAVDDVTLDVMPGDIFGFVGHNGAGKTTLIRAIVGVTGFDVHPKLNRGKLFFFFIFCLYLASET